MLTGTDVAAFLALALLVDALAGEPAWLYARVPHPVAALGTLIGRLESGLLDPADAPSAQRWKGVALVVLVVALCLFLGSIVQRLLGTLPLSRVWLALAASTLLAQRSLVDHVKAVAEGLRRGLSAGRIAVAEIVGRDPERLDEAGVARAAVESLAENLSDGVVAPAFWCLVGGLPGLLAYKALNTLDSIVGHRSERYRHFGWASARLDDLANWVPARLTALLLLVGRHGVRRAAIAADWERVARDAPHHRSPNAGWPEAAMAYLLGVSLAGPRVYGGERVLDAWMGRGREAVTSADISRAIRLAWRAWAVLLVAVAVLALVA